MDEFLTNMLYFSYGLLCAGLIGTVVYLIVPGLGLLVVSAVLILVSLILIVIFHIAKAI